DRRVAGGVVRRRIRRTLERRVLDRDSGPASGDQRELRQRGRRAIADERVDRRVLGRAELLRPRGALERELLALAADAARSGGRHLARSGLGRSAQPDDVGRRAQWSDAPLLLSTHGTGTSPTSPARKIATSPGSSSISHSWK